METTLHFQAPTAIRMLALLTSVSQRTEVKLTHFGRNFHRTYAEYEVSIQASSEQQVQHFSNEVNLEIQQQTTVRAQTLLQKQDKSALHPFKVCRRFFARYKNLATITACSAALTLMLGFMVLGLFGFSLTTAMIAGTFWAYTYFVSCCVDGVV